MTIRSVLSKVSSADIRHEPFPHLILEDVYPKDEYKRFEDAFPSLETVSGGRQIDNNYAYLLSMSEAREHSEIDPIWMDFFAYHSSRAFFLDVMRIFADDIRTLYPHLERYWDCTLEKLPVIARDHTWTSKLNAPEMQLDVQFGINSPVNESTSVRGPHVDSKFKLFNALWYFRDEEDSSTGGEFSFYRFKKGRPTFAGKQPHPRDVELVESVAYQPNRLVLFINSPLAVHGVMPRSITNFGRRYINFAGECYTMPNGQLFDRPQSLSWQISHAFDYVRKGELGPVFAGLKRRMLG